MATSTSGKNLKRQCASTSGKNRKRQRASTVAELELEDENAAESAQGTLGFQVLSCYIKRVLLAKNEDEDAGNVHSRFDTNAFLCAMSVARTCRSMRSHVESVCHSAMREHRASLLASLAGKSVVRVRAAIEAGDWRAFRARLCTHCYSCFGEKRAKLYVGSSSKLELDELKRYVPDLHAICQSCIMKEGSISSATVAKRRHTLEDERSRLPIIHGRNRVFTSKEHVRRLTEVLRDNVMYSNYCELLTQLEKVLKVHDVGLILSYARPLMYESTWVQPRPLYNVAFRVHGALYSMLSAHVCAELAIHRNGVRHATLATLNSTLAVELDDIAEYLINNECLFTRLASSTERILVSIRRV